MVAHVSPIISSGNGVDHCIGQAGLARLAGMHGEYMDRPPMSGDEQDRDFRFALAQRSFARQEATQIVQAVG